MFLTVWKNFDIKRLWPETEPMLSHKKLASKIREITIEFIISGF